MTHNEKERDMQTVRRAHRETGRSAVKVNTQLLEAANSPGEQSR